jgi:hypothetical protein
MSHISNKDDSKEEDDLDETHLLAGDGTVLENNVMHILQGCASSNVVPTVLSIVIVFVGTNKRGGYIDNDAPNVQM